MEATMLTEPLLARYSKEGKLVNTRAVKTPKEALNRAIPWCRNGRSLAGRMVASACVSPGTPVQVLELRHSPDVTGRTVRVLVASEEVRDAWIEAINKNA